MLPNQLSRFIWYFVKDYIVPISGIVIFSIVGGFCSPINSVLMKWLVNLLPKVAETSSFSHLTFPAILIVLNQLVIGDLVWRIVQLIQYKYQPLIKNKIITTTFDFVLGSSNKFFQDNLSGTIGSQISTLANSIESMLSSILLWFIYGIIAVFVTFYATYQVNQIFFWIFLIWFVVFTWFSVHMSPKIAKRSQNLAEKDNQSNGQIIDTIGNVESIRFFFNFDYEVHRLGFILLNNLKSFRKQHGFTNIVYTVQNLLSASLLGFSIYYLLHLYKQGLVTAGDFVLIIGIATDLVYIVFQTIYKYSELNKYIGSCNQALQNLIRPRTIVDMQGATDLTVSKGDIEFRNVTFSYNQQNFFVGQSVQIAGGTKVALVGSSGAGKSTFISLILRLFDLNAGTILIDGQDIRHVKLSSLYNNIGVVSQNTYLFDRTIMENIRYGKIDASDEQVILAAKKAQAHDFIIKLPDGYQTIVGEKGGKLSGGQKQRIAVARAILKDAPILILDEATSQLDLVNEKLVQKGIEEASKGKTTLVVTHRLAAITDIDRILVFHEGRIVQDGTHDELVSKPGVYKKLWNAEQDV